jgi:S-(hydroxymethyl)glutathione dehydrogenase/alcohol dehydrogenase
LGHEASGVVESVGESVTEFELGDHVVPIFVPNCGNCKICANSNLCPNLWRLQIGGFQHDGTTRFTVNGEKLYHFASISSFSEYAVVPASSCFKINKNIPLNRACLFGCGIPTGIGAVRNVAQVKEGKTAAIFGMGCIGLSVIQGCAMAGASRIIGVDTNPDKEKYAKTFGATDFINPLDYTKPIQEVLKEKTDGGLDYTFECVGKIETIKAALESAASTCGTSVMIGVPPHGSQVTISPTDIISGRTWKGTVYGGFKKDGVADLAKEYENGQLKVDEFVTHELTLDEINEGFDLLLKGKSIRTVINY